MTEPDGAANLPAFVPAGSTVATVLSWPQHLEKVDAGQMYVITELVRTFSQLDTTFTVDMLADLASHYGLTFKSVFDRLLERFGIERIYLAVTCLEEFSIRGRSDRNTEDDVEATDLPDMLEWLEELEAVIGCEELTMGTVHHYYTLLGGQWTAIRHYSRHHMAEFLDEESSAAGEGSEESEC